MTETLSALGVTPADVYVTPEAASKCRRSKHTRTDFRQEVLDKALVFLRTVRVISETGDPDELEALSGVEGIDTGEATLFLATKDKTDFLLLTSDKNALRALTDYFLYDDLYERHVGRVICFEALLVLIIKREGFSKVYPKIRRGQQYDGAVRAAMPGGGATEPDFVRAMEGYVQRLQVETQGLLVLPS